MRINSSMMIQQASQSGLVQKSLSKVLEKLSTGKNLNSASDDAAGIAVAKQLEAMTRGYKRAGENIGDALSALNIADGGASGISDILQRQNELATQASSDTLTNQDRQALDVEYQALNQELGRQADSTQYNGLDLLNGQSPLSNGTGVIQAGASGASSSQLQAPNTDMTAAAIGAGGSIATQAGAQVALNSISKSLDAVSAQRATLGATSNRLDYAARLNSTMEINTAEAQSRIEDLDYAQASMDLARNDILTQSALAATKNFNQISKYTVLGLLQ